MGTRAYGVEDAICSSGKNYGTSPIFSKMRLLLSPIFR